MGQVDLLFAALAQEPLDLVTAIGEGVWLSRRDGGILSGNGGCGNRGGPGGARRIQGSGAGHAKAGVGGRFGSAGGTDAAQTLAAGYAETGFRRIFLATGRALHEGVSLGFRTGWFSVLMVDPARALRGRVEHRDGDR